VLLVTWQLCADAYNTIQRPPVYTGAVDLHRAGSTARGGGLDEPTNNLHQRRRSPMALEKSFHSLKQNSHVFSSRGVVITAPASSLQK
jgi:hypothetical protein